MSDMIFDQTDQTVARQTNVAGDCVSRDKTTVIGNDNVVGDHNIVTIINNLVQGVRRLPTDYATRIQNFLVEYLGTPERPVPFGGRAAALAELDAWLDDASAPPYLLLTAPAGRGKSALLARWSQALVQRENAPAVIFLPVSVRFRTNLSTVVFASLAARLAYLHGDEVPLTSESAEIWRGMASSYLARPLPDGRPLLLLLDGVDEAADWDAGADLFPAAPPPGLRIVLAARQTAERPTEADWRRALGWERPDLARALDLTPLDRPGVADVLERMGVPLDVLARDVDVTTELHRLSAGDPLLVRLYVDDLWARGAAASRLRPEDLCRIKPGYAGYFDRWWADQRALWDDQTPLKEPAVQALLNLLACALGPLTAENVLSLAGNCGLNTWTLEEAMRPLARFIVGNGRGQGFVFQHPKLGDYFYGRLTSAERRAWEGRFLDRGKATLEALNTKTLLPREAPAYLVQYYGAHLERASTPDAAIYALVSEGWLRAWETLEGTHNGFLGDVARAWARAEAAHDLVMQVKCALCRTSVAALSANIPSGLLALAVEHGFLTTTQALVVARHIPYTEQCSEALCEIAPYLSPDMLSEALDIAYAMNEGRAQAHALLGLSQYLSSRLLDEVLTFADTLKHDWERAEVLIGLIPYLSPKQRKVVLAEALNTALSIKDAIDRAEILTKLAPNLTLRKRIGVFRKALAAADEIKWQSNRASVLSDLAPHLSPDLLSEALAVAYATEDKQSHVQALSGLAPYLQSEQRNTVLTKAINEACSIEDQQQRAVILSELAPYLSRELLIEVLDAICVIEDDFERRQSLNHLGPHLPPDLLPKALSIARAIEWEWRRAEALSDLAPHLPSELLIEAFTVSCVFEDANARVKALTGLAPYLTMGLISEALAVMRAIESEPGRAHGLTALVPYLPPEQQNIVVAEALAARAIEDIGSRSEVLTELTSYLPLDQRDTILDEILDTALTIGDAQLRISVLTRLARKSPPEKRRNVLVYALDTIRAIREEESCAEALINLVSFLPSDQRLEALGIALEMKKEGYRAEALTELALHFLPEERETIFAEALTTSSSIDWEWWRAEALTKMAPHLPSQLLTKALAVACVIEKENYRAEALIGLAPYLPMDLLAEAWGTAKTIENEEHRAEALIGLSPYLPLEQRDLFLSNALVILDVIRDELKRAYALERLAPHLPLEFLSKALVAAQAIEDEWAHILALRGLIRHLSPKEREITIAKAVTVANMIEDCEFRTEALIGLIPHAPLEQRNHILSEALIDASAIDSQIVIFDGIEIGRTHAFVELTPYLVTWANGYSEQVYTTMRVVFHKLTARPRPRFLDDFRDLLPFFMALVPEDSRQQVAADIFHAIQDVCTWWP